MQLPSALLLSFAALTYAAAQSAQPAQPPAPAAAHTATNPPAKGDAQIVKKMGTVTWDPDAHKLRWTVQTGSLVNGQFVPASEEKYEISPDDATMGNAEEKRAFDGDEADGLHQLLDILSLYCAESVAWWDRGAGEPLPSAPAPDSTSPQKPVRVAQPQTRPAPPKILPGMSVAQLRASQ